MASIVDTSVKIFNNTMTGAPVLSGTAGSLVALLDAVLVNGFDLKTPSSLTVAAGVATLAFTGSHSAQLDAAILVAGSSIAALNGEQKVTAVGPGFVRFATAAADGAASGSITFKMAPAGWEKVFSGVNKAVYRSLDPASTKMLLRVDDTSTTFARVVGYESMTDVDTGVGPFPTAAQIGGGGYWPKSNAGSSAAVSWAVHADARLFYLTVQHGVVSSPAYLMGFTRCFGDVIAAKPGGDPYACALNYSVNPSANSMIDGTVGGGGLPLQTAMPRSYTGLGSAVLHVILPYSSDSNYLGSGIDSTFGPFPSEVDGTLIMVRKYVTRALRAAPRADLPGFAHVAQSGLYPTFKQLDSLPGTDSFAGRRLQAVASSTSNAGLTTSDASNTGVALIDVTGPWR